MIFFVGDAPVLKAHFENDSGNVNPTTVKFFVQKLAPVAGNVTEYTSPIIENVSVGEYKLALAILTEADVGTWKFAATGVGAAEAGSPDGRFEVRPTLVSRS